MAIPPLPAGEAWLGRWALGGSLALGAAVAILGFVPATDTEGAPFPVFLWETNRAANILLTGGLVMSAALFSIWVAWFPKSPAAAGNGILTGFAVLVLGIALFFATFRYGTYSTGNIIVQVYEQPIFLVEWGFVTMLFVPIMAPLARRARIRKWGKGLPPPPGVL